MTPDELLAIFERDRDTECVEPYCHQTAADRRALVTELRKMTSARIRLATLAEAERTVAHSPLVSRAEKVGHKAAANAYDIALNILTEGTDEA